MATVTVVTAERTLEIEASSIVAGNVNTAGHLILVRKDGAELDIGAVSGMQLDTGVSYSKVDAFTYVGDTDPGAVAEGSVWLDTADIAGPFASTTQKGLVELATTAETTTGTDTVRAVTAAGVKAVADTKQATDADLTAFAALAPANDDVVQRKAGAWTNRTMAQLLADILALPLTGGTITGTVQGVFASMTNTLMAAFQAGDAFDRVRILADGSIEIGTGAAAREVKLGRTAANTLSLTTSDFRIATAGRGIKIAEGTNAKMGTATLVSSAAPSTVVVSTTAVSATSRIFLTIQSTGGTVGWVRISAKTAGTSFTITSSAIGDTSVIAWMIVDPA